MSAPANLNELIERLTRMETRLSHLESQVDIELDGIQDALKMMKLDWHLFAQQQRTHEPAMKALDRVVSAGLVLRWILISVVGVLAAVGTAASAWEVVQKWFSR